MDLEGRTIDTQGIAFLIELKEMEAPSGISINSELHMQESGGAGDAYTDEDYDSDSSLEDYEAYFYREYAPRGSERFLQENKTTRFSEYYLDTDSEDSEEEDEKAPISSFYNKMAEDAFTILRKETTTRPFLKRVNDKHPTLHRKPTVEHFGTTSLFPTSEYRLSLRVIADVLRNRDINSCDSCINRFTTPG